MLIERVPFIMLVNMEKATSESIISQIERSKREVIKKYNLLRRQLEEQEESLKRRYKPLTDEIISLKAEIRKPYLTHERTKIQEEDNAVVLSNELQKGVLLPELIFPDAIQESNINESSSRQNPTLNTIKWFEVEKKERSGVDEGIEDVNRETGQCEMTCNSPNSSIETKSWAGCNDDFDQCERLAYEDDERKDIGLRGDERGGKIDLTDKKEHILKNAGHLASMYLKGLLDSDNSECYDKTYGLRFEGGSLCLGDSMVNIVNDHIWIGDDPCEIVGTRGLFELLCLSEPHMSLVTKTDMDVYKNILKVTNTHKVKYSPEGKINRKPSNNKYNRVISKLFPAKTKR